MADLLNIMLNVIAPIFMVIGAAYIVGKRFQPDLGGLSTILIYIFVPSLVFQGISTTTIPGSELGGVVIVAISVGLIMMTLAIIISRVRGYPQRVEGAFVLSIMLVNAANYGIPLNTFAFGTAGGQVAIIYYVTSAIMGNILGVFFASRGQVSTREAMLNVFKVPIGYAAVLGLIFNAGDVTLPLPIARAVELASQAAVPGMMVLLGLNLARTQLKGRLQPILTAAGMKLLIAPFIALLIASLVGLTGVSFKVAIVESSMPTAVLATALATEFGSDAKLTSAVTLVATLMSVITLTVIITLLGGVTA